MEEVEQEKLDKISTLSVSLLDLKKSLKKLENDKNTLMHEKCSRMKKLRQEDYNRKTTDMDEKEKELCRRTNQLVDDLVEACDESRFNKALVQVLRNLKGKIIKFIALF